MSMFFFRLHNLRREEENKRRQQKRRQNNFRRSPLTLAPSRLFEKTPLTPSDSLDEIALKIPSHINKAFHVLQERNRILCKKGKFVATATSYIYEYITFSLNLRVSKWMGQYSKNSMLFIFIEQLSRLATGFIISDGFRRNCRRDRHVILSGDRLDNDNMQIDWHHRLQTTAFREKEEVKKT
ncbi:hypothetical protein M8J75_002314 [Diaphorina citri]|nr:hypothetical protein M8J75_002314 [Diaphorina citri]